MTLLMDIREKVMKAITGGMSCRQAAARFYIGPATAVRGPSASRPRETSRQ